MKVTTTVADKEVCGVALRKTESSSLVKSPVQERDIVPAALRLPCDGISEMCLFEQETCCSPSSSFDTSVTSTSSTDATTSSLSTGATTSSSVTVAQRERIEQKQCRLLGLIHAATCQHDSLVEGCPCPREKRCAATKRLFGHIQVCRGRRRPHELNDFCWVPGCYKTRKLWNHFLQCQLDDVCPICVAVPFSKKIQVRTLHHCSRKKHLRNKSRNDSLDSEIPYSPTPLSPGGGGSSSPLYKGIWPSSLLTSPVSPPPPPGGRPLLSPGRPPLSPRRPAWSPTAKHLAVPSNF